MKKLLILLGAMCLFLPQEVSATVFGGEVSCEKDELVSNEITECTIFITFSQEFDEIYGEISIYEAGLYSYETEDVKFLKITDLFDWDGTAENGVLKLYSNTSVKGNVKVAKFQIKANETTSGAYWGINVKNLKIYNNKKIIFETSRLNDFVIETSYSNTFLKELTVDGDYFNFDKNITTYDLVVDDYITSINAIAEDDTAIVSGIGNKELKYGKNTFVIKVSAKDGTERKYTINITRPKGYTDDFEKNDIGYIVTIAGLSAIIVSGVIIILYQNKKEKKS